MKRMKGISVVSMLHYVRLVYRSALFILLLIGYIRFRIQNGETVIENIEKIPIIIYVTWGVFVIEMIMRFFPSKYESPGSQKQFAQNFKLGANKQECTELVCRQKRPRYEGYGGAAKVRCSSERYGSDLLGSDGKSRQ